MSTQNTTLQTAAAAAQPVDPNTMVAANPAQQAAAPTIAGEHEQFVDEWAKTPTLAPGARTWVDPSLRDQPNGEYMAAWRDEATPAQQAPFTDATAASNASAIASTTAKAAEAEAAKPPAAAATPPQNDPWNTADTMFGPGYNGTLI